MKRWGGHMGTKLLTDTKYPKGSPGGSTLKNPVRTIGKSNTPALIMLLLLFSGIIATSYVAQQKQDVRKKAAGGASTPTITKLFAQHWATDKPDYVQNLPDYYSIFVNQTYNSDQSISNKTNPILAQYVGSDMVLVPGTHESNWPTYYDDILRQDETTFIHSTNPAELLATKGGNAVNLYWKYDERFQNIASLQYSLYRLKNATIDLHTLWNHSWKNLAWEKIATLHASNFSPGWDATGKYIYTNDTGFGTIGITCYLVKTVNAGNEWYFSLPTCINYQNATPSPGFQFTHSDVQLIKKEGIPNDNLYSNNTYKITVVAQSSNFYDPQLVLYGNDGGWAATRNQFSYNFHETNRYAMTKSNDIATLTITLKRPYLLNKGGKSSGFTEEPTFRIIAKDAWGAIYAYPYEGYLVLSENNKVAQRMWTGYTAIPSSDAWKAKIVAIVNAMRLKGYNATYFDLWMSRKYDLKTNGNEFDAPPFEFPQNWAAIGDRRDPATKSFINLGQYLRTALPPSHYLIGNSLTLDPITIDAIDPLDGAMFEACIHAGSEASTGQKWMDTLDILKRALAKGKKIICLPTWSPGDLSFFNSTRRIYTLASYLLISQDKTIAGNSYFGWGQIYPGYGLKANYYPELFVDIGNPAHDKHELGLYFWERLFSKGAVVVNASNAQKQYSLPANYYKVEITNVAVNRKSDGSLLSADSGKVIYTLRPKGTVETLPAASALLFTTELPTAPYTSIPPITPTPTQTPTPTKTPTPSTSAVKTVDFNSDGKVDIFDYNILISNFGKIGSPGFIPSDIDRNGKVDIFDYNVLIGNFGQ